MTQRISKTNKRARKHARVRARVRGTAARPRLAVFRSGKHIYAQIIDDISGKTLATANDLGQTAIEAKAVGEMIAKVAMAKKIKQVAFDRGGYIYAGRVKQVAEGARAGGLIF